MLFERCKHFDGKCPCLYCKNTCSCVETAPEGYAVDTDKLCDRARNYCESQETKRQWRYDPNTNTYQCPNCLSVVHERYEVFDLEADYKSDLNFCPHCGVKMDGGDTK